MINGMAAQRLTPPQKNSECKNPLEKFSPRFFFNQNDILLIDYLPKVQTINAEYYSSLLVQLKDILKEKRRGKVANAQSSRAIATQKNLACPGFQCLDHPSYSPDLAASNYHLICGLKKRKVANFRPTRRSLLPRRPG